MSPSHVTVPAPGSVEASDPELIALVREGDVAAYGALFQRHVDAANRLARLLVGGSDVDDLVSEAFVKVLDVLLAGGGPDVAFRAYLLTAVRRLHIDKVRSARRLSTTDDLTPFDPGVPFTDPAVARFEGGAAARAFASLPERWQLVLWHLEVENQKPADIAPLLGMTPNSVSALAYRAREGLRQAFLTMHAGDLDGETCRETNESLSGYVRNALSRRDAARVEDHLEHCRRCTAVYLELSEVNSSLAGVLGPALLGPVAAAYLGGGALTGAGASVLALLGRGRDAALSHVGATAATVAVAGVAGIAAVTVLDRPGNDGPASAMEPPSSGRGAAAIGPAGSGAGGSGSRQGSGGGSTGTGPVSTPSAVPGVSAPEGGTTPAAFSFGLSSDPTSPASGTTQEASGTGTTGATQDAPSKTSTGSAPSVVTSQGPAAGSVTPPQAGGDGTGTGTGSTPTPTRDPKPTTDPKPDPKPSDDPEPSADPKPSNDPRPSSDPKPSPDPKPSDDPKPSPEPSRTSTPEPTPDLKADVAVRVASVGDRLGHAAVTAVVSGVPTGVQVRLTVSASGGRMATVGAGCGRSGDGSTCAVTAGRSVFVFGVDAPSGATVRFSVPAADGYDDPSPGNNSASVRITAG